MRTFLDCVPCFVRQTLDAVRIVTDDESIHEAVLRKVLRAASEMNLMDTPPAMGRHIHRLIRELTGNDDPYSSIKQACNRLALELYPELRQKVTQSADPLETAARLAIAGNIIDFGVKSEPPDVHGAITHALAAPLDTDAVRTLRQAAAEAGRILYLGDNAGEIVFDKLLIEQLPHDRVTFVVKGEQIINDVTLEDAEATGMTDLAEVIENGSDAPGTILETCSKAFRDRFEAADLIVAKGQGNYETLSECAKDIFFLLVAKCPVIADDIGCEAGSLVIRRSGCLR